MAALICLVLALGFVCSAGEGANPDNPAPDLVSQGPSVNGYQLTCFHSPPSATALPRRYDITDMGYHHLFHGWVDVQGQGAANDFCRIVGNVTHLHLACALAGTEGQSDTNYVSNTTYFDIGYSNTWYMKDEDADGRDDYCRCIGTDASNFGVACTKAGPKGFYGSAEQGGNAITFTPTGLLVCNKRTVSPEFGRAA